MKINPSDMHTIINAVNMIHQAEAMLQIALEAMCDDTTPKHSAQFQFAKDSVTSGRRLVADALAEIIKE